MMKRRTVLLCLAALVCLAGVAFRIWIVNQDNERLVSKTYSMGETVAFGEDFFYTGNDAREGYAISVNTAEVKTIEAFLAEHGETMDFFKKDAFPLSHVYDIEVTIRNENTEENDKNIDLISMQLVTSYKSFQVDMDLLTLLYPQLSAATYGFRLKPDSEMTIHLPYAVHEWHHLKMEEIENKQTFLLLSMYPVKKMIEISPE